MVQPYVPIDPSETQAKAPIDETLMGKIRENFDNHESRLGGAASPLQFKLNGDVAGFRDELFTPDPNNGIGIDGATVTSGGQYTRCRIYQKINGTLGQTQIDLTARIEIEHAIKSITRQFDDSTQGIGRVGASLSTQAITKTGAQLNTQTITRVKSPLLFSSVVSAGGTNFRYNLSGAAADSDWKVGNKVVVSGSVNPANDGEFTIVAVNEYDCPSIVVTNGAGVAETGSTGSIDAQYFSYNFLNPADETGYVAGEDTILAGHTVAASDGTFNIEAVNVAGNNLHVFNNNAGATTQGAAAGTANAFRFTYLYVAALDDTAYIVGENLLAAGHTNPVNDGLLPIRIVNDGGNNVVVYNTAGVIQAGAAGTIDTNRWTYALVIDPTLLVNVGETIIASGHTSALNDGTFTVVEVNRLAINSFVFYNETAVAQGAAAGTLSAGRAVIAFAEDFSGFYSPNQSTITVEGRANAGNNGDFLVTENNRATFGAFNVFVENTAAVTQVDPQGKVSVETKSLFTTLPTLAAGVNGAYGGDDAVFYPAIIQDNTRIIWSILEMPSTGLLEELSIDLS